MAVVMNISGQSTAIVNQISFENLCHQINRLKLMSLQQDVILKCAFRWPHNLSTPMSELQRKKIFRRFREQCDRNRGKKSSSCLPCQNSINTEAEAHEVVEVSELQRAYEKRSTLIGSEKIFQKRERSDRPYHFVSVIMNVEAHLFQLRMRSSIEEDNDTCVDCT